jgi:hypothetical protein
LTGETEPCPLCGQPLYGWIALPPASGEASVGMPLSAHSEDERVIDRCERCGVALERGREPDLVAEWAATCPPSTDGGGSIAIPNRASLQASIGAEGWAAIELSPGRLLLTPASLELLAERTGHALASVRTPVSGRGQLWMWQTLLNGLTFHPNFAREVSVGRLRPANARSRTAFAVDLVVSVLGAPLVALVSIPLELGAAVARRGGEMRGQVVAGARACSSAQDNA